MNRTYVITGAGSGIGAATAKALKDLGNIVIGVDLKNSDIDADLSTPLGRHDGAKKVIEASNGSIDAVIVRKGNPAWLYVKRGFFMRFSIHFLY